VRLLANPMFVRMAAVLVIAGIAFVGGVIALRVLRRKILEDDVLSEGLDTGTTQYPYSAVIQQLKQQKFELQNQQQAQQRRAKTSEHVTASVIANLPCGILFVSANGLIRQANAAARQILGFASPLGMSIEEVFRDARATGESGAWVRATDMLKDALRGHPQSADLEFSYDTPSGDSRALKLTSIPLHTPAGESLGVAAVIRDESAVTDRRRAELLRSEVSAEMALELRTSLSTIRECASQIVATSDHEFTKNLANDISVETDRLGKVVGEFLAGDGKRKVLAARA
jgi:two-component system, NtrC family, sensor histidine kinase PilS